MSNTLFIFYRFSDGFQNNSDKKNPQTSRPSYFNKQKILLNFVKIFTNDNLYIIADNVSEESIKFLRTIVKSPKYLLLTNYKSTGFSFLYAANYFSNINITNKTIVTNDTPVYFVEDDYIHRKFSPKILLEGLKIADYVTLYDDPNKYKHPIHDNSLIVNIKNLIFGEHTPIFITESSHWKITNTNTMTFATKFGILKEDYKLYFKHCQTGYPDNHQLFLDLTEKKRTVICSIPGYSTNCKTNMLSPFIDWKSVLENNS